MTSASPVDHGKLAYDRQEVADALYRWALGLDTGDAEMFASALTEDVVVDFTRAGAKLGLTYPAIHGREIAVHALISSIGPLDTTHSATNVRVAMDGDRATLQAHVLAQHFPPGEGSAPDRTRHGLAMNRYSGELVRSGETWRFTRLSADNLWFEGDPKITSGEL
ncbi:nuclear transport factor 2 family protein [Amycolatopsis pithecellobii]|uniref:Nuclear transport factor 2 family protein n=1 Tax=Amycolatopsis pithecellobii TaxID=664692 RepID=A0A6N7YNH0_9PSEU|nr:nuclear transport factor 2 family protein [Amycolatopsis pithecellobii]MTD54547.1 nuclear transport factor 2 family protein [Amycolatopsis pithecellobii]